MTRTTLFMLMGIAMLLISLAPAIHAIPVCMDSRDGLARVVIPADGQRASFLPECLHVADGDTVWWLNSDASSNHNPSVWGCYQPPQLTPTSTQSTRLHWDAASASLLSVDGAGVASTCSTFGPDGETLVDVQPGEVAVTYFCQIHPTSMIGVIHIAIPHGSA